MPLSTSPFSAAYRNETSRNSTSPRARSIATGPPSPSLGESRISNTLSPAAIPCCKGPTMPTRRLSGAVISSSAVRKEVNSPMEMPLTRTCRIATYITAARPSAAIICTTGFDTALTVISFM